MLATEGTNGHRTAQNLRPRRRALAAAGHDDLESLTTATEREIADLHGMGPKALSALRAALAEHDLAFKPR
ncbi:DNA-binding protein [Actinomadura rayongensis]|uniref:DNA-binding protein n=1 Tax=Actinomadura rayongensis TaxID=1429076 RepID=A0A6I4VXW7_9ACTN|nr:DNA-binding protein [Actinomadura rayongensis]MXQ63239.1 DNA-binding protein [Actinomadura rayongensis]